MTNKEFKDWILTQHNEWEVEFLEDASGMTIARISTGLTQELYWKDEDGNVSVFKQTKTITPTGEISWE